MERTFTLLGVLGSSLGNRGSLACLVAFLSFIMAASGSTSNLVELSYTYNIDAPTSPKLTPFTFKVLKKGFNDLGIWVELNEFCSSEHSGTHLDAPVHFAKDRWSVNEIPTERLWRVPAIVIDVSEAIKRSGQIDYPIKVEDLAAWEKQHGIIPDGALVLIRTGWGLKAKDLQAYSNVDDTNTNHFPGLSKEAATWLATHGQRHGHRTGVVGVGVDTISVDVGNSTKYDAHVAMYSRNLFGLENVANMHKLPASGFRVTILPMRIGGGSGAPARIIAELGQDSLTSASSRSFFSLFTFLPVFFPFLLAMLYTK